MQPQHITGKKVLYGCLNWGSGHVARSIPLMQQLIDQGNDLTVRCTSAQQKTFVSYGIVATYWVVEGFQFQFKGDGRFAAELLRNGWRFRKSIQQDKREVADYCSNHTIDYILSDHCYGLQHSSIHSVFITHQVQLPPKSGFFAQFIHRNWLKRFQTVWIMDNERESLAGQLSKKPTTNNEQYHFIGHYSRFSTTVNAISESKTIVAIISGPEPYSEQLFEHICQIAHRVGGKWTVISPKLYFDPMNTRVTILQNDWKAADEAIITADWIISRNGYTTLMDLHSLQKKAILIPTKGQLEQLYLAELHAVHPLWKLVKDEKELELVLQKEIRV